MKHVVLHSGGHSSSICAIENVRKFGKENVILLNHDISSKVESQSVKQYKQYKHDVADYLGMSITYANHDRFEEMTPIEACIDARAWKVGNGQILCTNRLKTDPFKKWMKINDQEKENVYVYGFDKTEIDRVQRRSSIMGQMGYKTSFPMLWSERTIENIEEVGITRPNEYEKFKHANCIGCLKAGWQHWYIVYCIRPDIWEDAKRGEDIIDYSLHKTKDAPVYLEEKEQLFADMKALGIVGTEHIPHQRFWADAKRLVRQSKQEKLIPVDQLDELSESDDGVCMECIA